MTSIGRTRVGTTALAVLAGLLAPTAAHADDTVPVFDDLPAAVAAVQVPCDAEGAPLGDPAEAPSEPDTSPTPHLNAGSRLLLADAGHLPGLRVTAGSLDDLATFGLAAYETGSGRAVVEAVTGSGAWTLRTQPYLTQVHPWRVLETAGATWAWSRTDGTPDPGSGTLADFAAAHGDGASTAYLWLGSCAPGSTTTPVHVDALRVGPEGDATTYDFEAAHVTLGGTTGGHVPGTRVYAAGCFLWTGTPSGQEGVPGETLVFEARRYGDPAFAPVGTAVTGASGYASVVDRPLVNTSYRCRYDGNDGSAGQPYPAAGTARPLLCRVPVRLSVEARRAHHGRDLLATGRATPAHPGATVTLHGRHGGHTAVLGRSRVRRNGSYRVQAAARGRWRVWVTLPRTPGNDPGRSVTRTVG